MNPLLRYLLIATAVAVVAAGGTLAGLAITGGGALHDSAAGRTTAASTTIPAPSATTPITAPKAEVSQNPPPTATVPPTTATTALPGPAGRPVPDQFAPVSVTFVSPHLGWVLGSAPCPSAVCTSVARTTDGGAHWKGIPAPVAPLAGGGGIAGPGVSQLVFADPLDGWAYGPALYSTHNGGSTWQRVALPPGATAITSMAAAGGDIFAVAATDDGAGPPMLLRGADRGDSFSTVGSGPPARSPILAAAGNRAWALGAGSLQVIPAGKGRASNVKDPCPGDGGGGAIAAWSSKEVALVCAESGGLGSEAKQAYTSSNGGGTFTPTASSPPPQGEVESAGTNGTSIVVGASSGATELYASYNDGHSWSTAYDDASGGAPLSDLGFTTSTQGVAIEGVAGTGPQPFLLMTTDGAHTWSRVPIAG
jgi:photosystem II stability/assembly factor-like uncharacterized protein